MKINMIFDFEFETYKKTEFRLLFHILCKNNF
jgi:hypothetical protein